MRRGLTGASHSGLEPSPPSWVEFHEAGFHTNDATKMSRFRHNIPEGHVTYGLDIPPHGREGFFVQVRKRIINGSDVPQICLSGDTRASSHSDLHEEHMSRFEIADILEENGVNEQHVRQMRAGGPLTPLRDEFSEKSTHSL
mgnify:CR=1 FL=1